MHTLLATATFGLEKVVKNELKTLGFAKTRGFDGGVEFDGELVDIARANMWLRCADRVLLKLGAFTAVTFDELFEQTKALPWEQWIPVDGKFDVRGKSNKSQLHNVSACQAIVKKAVVERLKEHYAVDWFAETGASYTIQVSLLKDTAVLTIDTSGAGLHKRGYRLEAGEAPIKETLAAALVQLSFWNKERLLIDPMCGAGTILIEAAMIGRNIPPGWNRSFAAEEWSIFPDGLWDDVRREAKLSIDRTTPPLQILGYDIEPSYVKIAQANAKRATVERDIEFRQKDVKKLWIDQQYGILISNAPYGIRIANFQELNQIYIALNKTFRKKSGWSVYVLTADKKFPNYFKRARPNRVRKLYNGRIETNYYQYYGDKPE